MSASPSETPGMTPTPGATPSPTPTINSPIAVGGVLSLDVGISADNYFILVTRFSGTLASGCSTKAALSWRKNMGKAQEIGVQINREYRIKLKRRIPILQTGRLAKKRIFAQARLDCPGIQTIVSNSRGKPVPLRPTKVLRREWPTRKWLAEIVRQIH